MSDTPPPAPNPSSAAPANAGQPDPAVPRKKGGLGCLGIVAIVAGVVAVLLLILGILLWQSVSWMKNGAEAKIVQPSALQLSEGEEKDVKRIIVALDKARHDKTTVDETVTPRVLNGVIEWIIKGEMRKPKPDPDTPPVAHFEFQDKVIHVMAAFPARDTETKKALPGMYLNAEMDMDLEIEDGVITKLDVYNVTLGGKPAPFLARSLIDSWAEGIQKATKLAKDDPKAVIENGMKVFKLVKREGDRLHIIIDGAYLKKDD